MSKKSIRLANTVKLSSIMKKYHVSSTALYNRINKIPNFRKKYAIKLHRHLYITKRGAKKIAYPPRNHGGRVTKVAKQSRTKRTNSQERSLDSQISVKDLAMYLHAIKQSCYNNNKIANLCSKISKKSVANLQKDWSRNFVKFSKYDDKIYSLSCEIKSLRRKVDHLKTAKTWTNRIVAATAAIGFLSLICLKHSIND